MHFLIAWQKRVSWAISQVEEVFLGVILAAATLFTVAAIVFRYVLYWNIPWPDEAARNIMIILIFIGAAAAVRRRENIVVEVLPHVIRKKLTRDTIKLGVNLLCLICCGVWLYLTYKYMMHSWKMPNYAPGGGYHMGFIKSSLFVGVVLMTGHWVAIVVKDAVELVKRSH